MPTVKKKEMTAPGVHKAALAALEETNAIKRGMKLLELGCGEGAFSERILQKYQCEITGIDINKCENFPGKFLQVNLNTDFPQVINERYDIVCAIEVIEHLENPFAFIRGCASVLERGGFFLFTTPNIGEFWSRVKYLLKGRHFYFDDNDLITSGHIMPLGLWQIRYACQHSNLDIIYLNHNRKSLVQQGHYIKFPFLLPISLMRFFVKGEAPQGEIHIIVAQKL